MTEKKAELAAEVAIARNQNSNIPTASVENITVKRGVGRVLNFIQKNPGMKPGEINESLGFLSHRSNLWQTLRWSGLVVSDRSHYTITPLGRRLLREAGITR